MTDVVPSKHEFSSTQFNLPPESAAKLARLGAQIPDADLADDGREDAPHITVKYGLHADEPGQLHALLAEHPPITVRLGKTSVFPAGESGSGDVLKADVDSPELHALNAKIADALPHTDTHPKYVPHATIAYLKPGLGEKYAGDDSLAGHTMTFDHLTFSGKDGKAIDIPLGGSPVGQAPDETLAQRAARLASQRPPETLAARAARLAAGASPAPEEGLAVRAARLAGARNPPMPQSSTMDLATGKVTIDGPPAPAPTGDDDPQYRAALAAAHAHAPGPASAISNPPDGPQQGATVTAGPVTTIGTPTSEIDRLANTGDLKTRIAARLALIRSPNGYAVGGTSSPFDKAASAVGGLATDAVVEPVKAAVHAVLSPSIGEERPDPKLVAARFGGIPQKSGPAYDAEHGGITDRERTVAGLETAANVLAPKAGEVAGKAISSVARGVSTKASEAAPAIKSLVSRFTSGATDEALAATGDDALAAAGERFSGLPISTRVRDATRTAYRSALVTPYAEIEHAHPALADALLDAGAAAKRAEHVSGRRLQWVHEGLDADQVDQFGKKLVLDNMDAEATRKQQAALDLMTEHQAATKDELRAKIEGELYARQRKADMLPSSAPARYAQLKELADLRTQLAASSGKRDLEGMANELFAKPLSDAAQNWTEHAAKLRPSVTQGVESEPWFTDALDKYKTHIETPLRESAITAGVDASGLRQPATAYVKLSPTKHLDDADIRRALDVAGVTDVADLQRRPALLRKILGENPALRDYFAPGAGAPRQGPLQATVGPQGGVSGARAQRTGSANMAAGTADEYSTDLARILTTDAPEKIRKGAQNQVLQEVAAVGRKLAPGEAAQPGLKVVAFDDQGGIVTGDSGTHRFEVSPEVQRAMATHQNGTAPQSAAFRGVKKGADVLTRAQISGMPVEATSHANTIASIVAKVPGERSLPMRALAANPIPLPGAIKGQGKFMGGYTPAFGSGAKLAAIHEMNTVDFSDPATRALESRLSDIGALRIEEPHGGMINASHRWLFGPEGVDPRGRLVLAQRLLARNPSATDAELREFVTGKLGNYISANAGALPNFMAKGSLLSPFARFQSARIPTAIKTVAGQSGLPASSIGQRVGDVTQTLWRGPVGLGVGSAAATKLLTGHSQSENEPGHALDIDTGLYAVPGGIRRLSKDEAAAMGDHAKPLYIPAAMSDPISYAGLRATGARAALFSPETPASSKLAEGVRDVANVGLGTLGPAARFAQTAVTGTTPYLQRDNTFMRVAPKKFDKNQELRARLGSAVSHMNPAVQAFSATSGDAGTSLGTALEEDGKRFGGPASIAARSAEFLLPRFLAPTVGGRDNAQAADAQLVRDYTETLAEYARAIKRAPGPIGQARIIAEARAGALRAGFDPDGVEVALQKAADQDHAAVAEKNRGRLGKQLQKIRP